MQRRTIVQAVEWFAFLAFVTTTAGAQERRRAPEAVPRAATPAPRADARMPFAGLWAGTRSFRDGPAGAGEDELRLVFEVDSARGYRGYQSLPNNAHAPYDRVALTGVSLTWQHPNSGGGTWMYTARLSSADVMEGSMTLVDWPQGGGARPVATFKLARQRARPE
ncbi:MAG: hypothetical protein U0132_04990 [Gemmatimonadaceae bacterium]